jgi:FkbM family methyltransferase
MKIEKVNGFWVPSDDIHLEDWKSGKPFTQNKCLLKFLRYCEDQNKKFRTVLDIGAWCGTWSKAIEPFAQRVVAFEPDAIHFDCLQKNCTINCSPRQEAVGSEEKWISLTDDTFTQAKRIDAIGKTRMTTIDILNFENVDLIKIDVEGYEMEVIKGAEKTLARTKFLMIELNNNTKKYGSSNVDVEKKLKDLGFKVIMEHWPDKVFYRVQQ